MKSKRKQNIVKKVHELARLANLKISLVFFDPAHNTLQEMHTAPDFDVEAAREFIQINSDSSKQQAVVQRRKVPQWNHIEKISTKDFLKGYKQFQHLVERSSDTESVSQEPSDLVADALVGQSTSQVVLTNINSFQDEQSR